MIPERAIGPRIAPKFTTSLAAALAVVTGSMVLVGWALDITALKSIRPGWVSMKPNSALAFTLTGIALLFSSLPPSTLDPRLSGFLHPLARLCGWMAGLMGVLTLSEYIFAWNPGIDLWLFAEPAGTVGTSVPGRMAPDSALCFGLLAAGMEITRHPHKTVVKPAVSAMLGWLVTTLALAAILNSFTPILGDYGWWGTTSMAVPTAAVFAVLGATTTLVAWQEANPVWSLSGRITAAFACGLGLLVLIGLTTSQNWVRLYETTGQLMHTEKILDGIGDVLENVANAQTHVRGYALTGDERFQIAHVSAAERSRKSLADLRQLAAAIPHRASQIAQLQEAVEDALSWFQHVSDVRQSTLAVSPYSIRLGDDLMENLRARLARMEKDEARALEQTRRKWERETRVIHTIIVASTALGLIIFSTALLCLNHAVSERNSDALRTAALLELSTSANTVDDKTLLQQGLNTIQRLTDSRIGFLHFVSDDQNEIELVTWSSDTLAHYCHAAFDSHYPVSAAGIWADCIRLKQPIAINDYAAAPGKRGLPKGHSVLQRFVSVPIFENHQVRMIVGVGNAARDYEVRDIDTATLLGNHLYRIVTHRRATEEVYRLNQTLEQRVRERTAQLQTSNLALEQFAYVASHDLREPLRMVVGYVQLIEKHLAGKLNGDTREFMGYAVEGALRMQDMIRDILDYSRITTRGEAFARVDSAAALDDTLKLLARQIADTGAEVEAQSLPMVIADRTQLVQLFQNLIGNAIKFCKDHAPRVRVAAVHEAGWWRFSVIDNGIGIAPEYRAQLFAIFKRLHTRSEFPGTGIGLAICKRIVERHGGEIGIDSAPGGGSVFWFTLPEEKAL